MPDDPVNPQANTTTYFSNPEAAEELDRLHDVETITTEAMGGVLPAGLDVSHVPIAIDLACGPGGWATKLARTYPHMEVIGVDISKRLIQYARAQARGVPNVSFTVGNILHPLDFPDESVGLINARLISSFMTRQGWPALVQECKRILQPGGLLRLTEGEWLFTNGEASEQIASALTRAMWVNGQSFSAHGERFGATLVLPKLLREAHFVTIQKAAYSLEISAQTEAWESWYHSMMVTYPLLFDFIVRAGVATRESLERLYHQAMVEWQDPEFLGEFFLLSVWGEKPPRS